MLIPILFFLFIMSSVRELASPLINFADYIGAEEEHFAHCSKAVKRRPPRWDLQTNLNKCQLWTANADQATNRPLRYMPQTKEPQVIATHSLRPSSRCWVVANKPKVYWPEIVRQHQANKEEFCCPCKKSRHVRSTPFNLWSHNTGKVCVVRRGSND